LTRDFEISNQTETRLPCIFVILGSNSKRKQFIFTEMLRSFSVSRKSDPRYWSG